MIDLGTLGGAASLAVAVNDGGQIVGRSRIAGNSAQHAFSWTAAGGMIDLGGLGPNSTGVGVNGTGQVIGFSTLAGNIGQHAFSWTAGEGMIDLGTLGGPNSEASAVNDGGHVVGWSHDASSNTRPTLWRPLTPAEALANLLAAVNGMTFEPGSAVLQAALASLDHGNTGATCNQLEAFINQVVAAAGKSLTPSQADQLIDAAAAIQAMLACS
jgi:probable HAF family extracellular repeat protein